MWVQNVFNRLKRGDWTGIERMLVVTLRMVEAVERVSVVGVVLVVVVVLSLIHI